MSVKRYDYAPDTEGALDPNEDGDWVLFAEHESEIKRLQAENDAFAHRVLRAIDEKANAEREIERLQRELKDARSEAEHWKPYRIARDFDRAGNRTLCASMFFSEATLRDFKSHDEARDFVRRALADVPDKAVRAAFGIDEVQKQW